MRPTRPTWVSVFFTLLPPLWAATSCSRAEPPLEERFCGWRGGTLYQDLCTIWGLCVPHTRGSQAALLCCPSPPEGSASVGGSQHIFPFLRAAYFPSGTRKQPSASQLPISMSPVPSPSPDIGPLHFQMCSGHWEGSWPLGQLTTPSTFSRTFSWCFWCMPLAASDVFSLRGRLPAAVLSLSIQCILASCPGSFSFKPKCRTLLLCW